LTELDTDYKLAPTGGSMKKKRKMNDTGDIVSRA